MSVAETLPPSGVHKVSKSNSSYLFNHTGISQIRLHDDKSAVAPNFASINAPTNDNKSNSYIEVINQEEMNSKKNQSVQRSISITDQSQLSVLAQKQEAANGDLHTSKIMQIQRAHSREMKKKEFMNKNCKNINPRSIQKVITKSILN